MLSELLRDLPFQEDEPSFIKHPSCARHLSSPISGDHCNSLKWVFYRQGKWSSERLSNLPKITQLLAGRTKSHF